MLEWVVGEGWAAEWVAEDEDSKQNLGDEQWLKGLLYQF